MASNDDSTNLPEKPLHPNYFETGVMHNYASYLFLTLGSKIEEPGQNCASPGPTNVEI